MTQGKTLVMGASGFLGSHVVKALAAEGRDIRIFTRTSSDISAINHLPFERAFGDVRDKTSVRRALQGCSIIYYCVVDTRAWLRDTSPLYETNVEGLQNTLDAVMDAHVERFIYTSTFMTLGLNPLGVATERDRFNWWDRAPDYVRVRVEGEELFLDYCRHGLPGVACNVAMTLGADDRQPTPHGWMVGLVVRGKLPAYWDARFSVVGIRDAAQALLLAERYGRVGQRYLITERTLSLKEVFFHAARSAGRRPLLIRIPIPFMYLGCWLSEKIAWLRGRETPVTVRGLRLMRAVNGFDSSKARQELRWHPRPAEEAIADLATWITGVQGKNY